MGKNDVIPVGEGKGWSRQGLADIVVVMVSSWFVAYSYLHFGSSVEVTVVWDSVVVSL